MRSDAIKGPCEILGCTRAESSHGVCRQHAAELRAVPGPKCPRCGLRRFVGAHGVCRHCDGVLLARREVALVIDRGMCGESGCWRRATALGRCEHHRPAGFQRQPSKDPCSVAGCGRCIYARGLCVQHWREAAAAGTLPASRLGWALPRKVRVNKGKTCAADGCHNKAARHGLCIRHWSEQRGALCANPRCGRLAAGGKFCCRCYDYRRRRGFLPRAASLRAATRGPCSVPGCDKLARALGLCWTHYDRRKRGAPVLRVVLPRGKHTVHAITIDGVTRSLTEWAELRGLNRITVSGRLARGWTAADALSLAPRQRNRWTKES